MGSFLPAFSKSVFFLLLLLLLTLSLILSLGEGEGARAFFRSRREVVITTTARVKGIRLARILDVG